MRRVDIRTIPEGAVLARALVDQRGAYVLAAGKAVTETMASRLWERGFRYAYVEAPGFEGIDVREPLEPQTFMHVRQLLAPAVSELMQGKEPLLVDVPVLELQEVTGTACAELARQNQGFLLYPAWGTLTDRFIAGVINTAVVAARIGLELGEEEGARHLFLAALLQDLGTWKADRAVDHVGISLNLVRNYRGVSAWVKHIVADHHERLDGSGYPQGKKGEDMHKLPKIMQVAVAYVDMVQEARRPTLPHEAQELLMAEAGTQFDWDAVQALRTAVPGYPAGSVVRLSSGQLGVVVHPGPQGLNRPRVRVLSRWSARRPQAAGGGSEAGAGLDAADAAEERIEFERPEAGGPPETYVEIDLAAEHAVAIKRLLES